MRWFKHVWVQILAAALVGIVLVLAGGQPDLKELRVHVGVGFIVAAIVTGLYHLREFSELFREVARSTLVGNDYLALLDLTAIRRLRTNAASEILRRGVNNPRYARVELEQFIDELLYGKLVPKAGTADGVYREHYTEHIFIEFVELNRAREILNLNDLDIEDAEHLVRETSIVSYSVVAPRTGDISFASYEVPVSATMADVPGIPLPLRAKCWVGTTEHDAQAIQLTFKDGGEPGFEYAGRGVVPFHEGQAQVWLKLEEWRIGFRQPEVLSLMTVPTRGVRVEVRVMNSDMEMGFQGVMIGMGATAQPQYGPNCTWLDHRGWLLQDQGYSVWWWRRSPSELRLRDAQVSGAGNKSDSDAGSAFGPPVERVLPSTPESAAAALGAGSGPLQASMPLAGAPTEQLHHEERIDGS